MLKCPACPYKIQLPSDQLGRTEAKGDYMEHMLSHLQPTEMQGKLAEPCREQRRGRRVRHPLYFGEQQ